MRVAVIGAGYVGLVSAVGLAEHGHRVVCVDADPARVAAITEGRPPIAEPGLAELLRRHAGRSVLATGDLAGAVLEADLTLLCVGTPSGSDGSIDTSALEAAAEQVGSALRARPAGTAAPVVVVKSTVVPGVTDGIVAAALARGCDLVRGRELGLGVNPEFLTEGQAVADFLEPDRLVIGGDELAVAAMRRLYAGFTAVPLIETTARTAEMIKYASNALLATAISFANEIALISDAVGGIDALAVMQGVHASRYLTTPTETGPVVAGLASFLEAGCGYGGSCLPKDVAALSAHGRSAGASPRMLEAVAAVNADQPARLVALVRRELGALAGRSVTVLGLAFKPDTDDVRHSPAFPVLRGLVDEGARVLAHDPVVGPEVLPSGVGHTHDLACALAGADAVVLVTRWGEYLAVPGLLRAAGAEPLVVDGRRLLDPRDVPRYAALGLSDGDRRRTPDLERRI
ncbi:UDP-glucose/GDP-mannose dehydrogenase family protein [Pseudonocardia xishanensis]|uniref:UDP-glucose 6-dehydrogenase n=1 Tax=Pseudonocardia xishanensis TaxID=630995 RepID=A0ABP8S1M2_9PSEU